MAEPPHGAAAPRGRGRAWERGGSAHGGEDGTELSGPAHNGSGTEPPGPAHNGSGTELSGPAHNGSDTEPPGPVEDGAGTDASVQIHNGSGTDGPGLAHNGSDTEFPGPAEDEPGMESPSPQEDAEPPGAAEDGPGTEPPGAAEDGPSTEPPSPQEDAAPLAGPELSLVPPELRARLLDRRDYRGRAQAVEQLRRALEGCSPAALGAAPAASLLGLIALLDALLRDPNFAVARGALQATRLLALRLGRRVPAVLAPLVCAAARALGDAQPAMRRDSARLLLRLMAAAGPRPVLRLLLQERLLRHRSARLREELLNTCIAALLAYPAAELDLPRLAAALAPALLDAKRRVRHAAMEALAALAAALGPGGGGALLLRNALDAVELRAGGAGVVRAVQARLARKVLPRLGEQGLVEYGVPLPSSGHCRGACPPPGPDTEWLLMGSRSRSAHGHCGHPACRDACARRGLSPRRVLSAGRGKNKLPWESELAAEREGGSAVRMPVSKGVEQLAACSDFLASQAVPGREELCPSRSRAARTALQPGVELSSEQPVPAAALGSHQPQISGKCGTLGYPQARGRSGSVGSGLQFLGLNNCQQDKVCSSLSFSSKTQRSFCPQAEPTMSFQGPSASQGSFILPSFPLSSPRSSPRHLSSAGKSQENPRSFSSSWPLKSFQGLPKPGGQKLSPKPGDSTGDSLLEKHSLQLEKPSLPLEKHSLPLEKHSLPLEKHSLPLEKHSVQLEKPPLQLEKHSVQLEKPSLPLEKHSLPLEKHSLPLEKHSLPLEKPSLQLEKHSVQLEKHSVQLEKHSVQLEKHSVQLEKPSLPLEKHSLPLEKHSLPLEKHSVQLEKPSLPLEKPPPPLEKPPPPLRAALGRARPVPPIVPPIVPSPREPPGPAGLPQGLAQLHLEQVEQEEMQNSLRSLRNSAAKKRAKLSSSMAELESPGSGKGEFGEFGDSPGDCPSQGSSPGAESGVYSRESPGSPAAALPPRRRVMSDTFPALGSKSHSAKASPARPREAEGAEHHPSTGPAEAVPGFAPKNDLGFTPEDVVVVGKGVFGSPPAPAPSQSLPCVATGEGAEPAPGRSFQQSSTSHPRSHSHGHGHAGNGGELKVTLSKSAQEKLRRKRKEDKEHNHREQQEGKDLEGKEEFPWERIRLSMSEPETLTAERFNLCGDLLTSPRNGSLSLENVALNPSLKRTSSLKRSKCSSLLDSEAPVTPSPEVLDPAELQPFPRPEPALAAALALLADHDWEKKIEGLNFVRCLSAYHAPVLTAKLHETTLAVAQEVKNLRSGVSRAAVVCLGDLFTHLKKSMDQEVDNAVKVLLHKAGESNTFIREEVDKALKAMVNNVTPARALCSLINGGQSHLHSAVRRCTAQHLGALLERLGPERGLARPAAERLLPAIANFCQDSSQHTRYYGRRMLFSLMAHPDLDKALEKFVPARDLPFIKETVGSLREKGLGEMPLDTPSAKGRRSQTGNVGHLRSSSTCRDAPIIPDRASTEAQEGPRRAAPRSALESEEYVRALVGSLNARDFRERVGGVRQLLQDTERNPALVLANMVKIFDAFKPRLHDSNSKVNQVALEALHKMIPLLRDSLAPVINMLIPAIVDNNLNSKNPGIYAAATSVIQALCQHVDTSLLLQPFCTKAQFLSGKAKQDLTERLAELVPELYPRKPCAVEQKVLPVLWHLLGSSASGGSAAGLARALWAQMGPGLLAHAAAQPPHIRKSLEELLETGT